MRSTICSCLLAYVLCCNVSAAINHTVVEEKEKDSVTLPCPHTVEGKVTWSRETNGSKVDILTVDGDKETRHNDPGRRYSSQADKALYILRAAVSDTGTYLCNNEPAVQLTVIPPGTVRLTAAERTNVTLKCPPDVGGSAVPTWSKNSSKIRQKGRFNVSPVDKTLTIRKVKPGDSGLYYCDGKPAAYLTVTGAHTEGKKAPPTTTSTPATTRQTTTTSTPATTRQTTTTSTPATTRQTTTTSTPATTRQTTTSTPKKPRLAAATAAPLTPPANTETTKEKGSNNKDGTPKGLLGLVIGIVASFLLLLFIILYFIWRRWSNKRGSEGVQPFYEEIQEGAVFRPTSDASDPNDPTYCTIPDLPPGGKMAETFLNDESPYSLIDSTFLGGNYKGSTQLTDNTYFLLEKPKVPENTNDQSVV